MIAGVVAVAIGVAAVATFAPHRAGAPAGFAAYVGISVDRTTLDEFIVTPTRETWSFDDDRGVLCTVGSPGHPTKATVRHSGR